MNTCDHGWGVAPCVPCLQVALIAERERADRAEAALECGHPASLMLHSAETGEPLYCELCDMRSQRNDAVQMEEHYKAERDALRERVARLRLERKPCGDIWLHVNAPSGNRASVNLGHRPAGHIVQRTLEEVAALAAREGK